LDLAESCHKFPGERRKRIRKVQQDRKHAFEAEGQKKRGFKMEIH